MLDAIAELKARWSRGETTTNCWLTIPNAFTAEIASRSGFDTVGIDMQHGLVDFTAVTAMLQATTASGKPTIVRVPWNEPSIIMRVLDMGAGGVIVPMVETAEQAERAVAACYYAPRGNRSYGPTRAAVVYPEYYERANGGLLVFVMIETKRGLENLDEILATPGLTGVYVGPADLSVSLGYPPETDSRRPEHNDAVKRIIAACHERGLFTALHTGGPGPAAETVAWGVDMVTIAADNHVFKAEMARRAEEFARLTKGRE